MSESMAGRVVVITGGNTGIGRATAEQLAKKDATVVMICRSKERGEEARGQIVAASKNDKVELVVADVSVLADVRRAASEILARHPKIHVLINNAAIFSVKREETVDGIEKTFATNYLGHFLLTNLLLPGLKAAAPSRVISVATKTTGLKIDLDDLQLKNKKFSTMAAVGPT